jgi:hypothetical protein
MNPERRVQPDEVVAILDSKLSLSDDQKAKITPIIADRQEKIRELADSSGRHMRKGRQMKSIYEESDQKNHGPAQRRPEAEVQGDAEADARECQTTHA